MFTVYWRIVSNNRDNKDKRSLSYIYIIIIIRQICCLYFQESMPFSVASCNILLKINIAIE